MPNPPSRLFIAGLLALAACLLAGCSSSRARATDIAQQPLPILTYNIHHGQGIDGALDLQRIADVITGSDAQLVALQEVDINATRTGSVDQIAKLADLTGMHGAFAPFMDFQGGQYGLAILSRKPITQSWTIPLPPGKHEPRSALAVRVGDIVFVCLHLDWLEDDQERFAQAGALIEALAGETRVVLAGDFNDRPGSRTIALFEETYTNAPKPDAASATFPSVHPDRQIDFVMYRPSQAFAATARVLDEPTASDHRPVLAQLQREVEPPALEPQN